MSRFICSTNSYIPRAKSFPHLHFSVGRPTFAPHEDLFHTSHISPPVCGDLMPLALQMRRVVGFGAHVVSSLRTITSAPIGSIRTETVCMVGLYHIGFSLKEEPLTRFLRPKRMGSIHECHELLPCWRIGDHPSVHCHVRNKRVVFPFAAIRPCLVGEVFISSTEKKLRGSVSRRRVLRSFWGSVRPVQTSDRTGFAIDLNPDRFPFGRGRNHRLDRNGRDTRRMRHGEAIGVPSDTLERV